MSEKQNKKFRRSIRNKTNKLANGIIGQAASQSNFKIARQRDILFIIVLAESAIIIGLIILGVILI